MSWESCWIPLDSKWNKSENIDLFNWTVTKGCFNPAHAYAAMPVQNKVASECCSCGYWITSWMNWLLNSFSASLQNPRILQAHLKIHLFSAVVCHLTWRQCLKWKSFSTSTPLPSLTTRFPIPSHLETLHCSFAPFHLLTFTLPHSAFYSISHLSLSPKFLLAPPPPSSALWFSLTLVCMWPHLLTKHHHSPLFYGSISYSRKQYNTNQSSFPNGKSTLTWEDTPFPPKNARSNGSRTPANVDPGASRRSHFGWDSKVMQCGPGVAQEVNGVLTEDVTAAIKMQISSQSRRCPESALYKPG